jgi:hypothetical protein
MMNYFTNGECVYINTSTDDIKDLRLLYTEQNNVAFSYYAVSYDMCYAILS